MRRAFKIAALCLAAATLAAAQTPAPGPVTVALASDHWTPVPLPTQMLALAAQAAPGGPVLWAGGFQGDLWRSDDGGRTWRLAFHGAGNDLIFAIDWPDGQHGFAAGSDRLWVTTKDGGRDWRRGTDGPPGGVNRLTMADDKHGIAAGVTRFWVRDSDFWQGHTAGDQVHGIAALGKSRLAVLHGEEAIAESSDGGAHWSNAGFAAARPNTVITSEGRFWIFGSSGSTPAQPLAAVQVGQTWDAITHPSAWLDACTRQGCVANNLSWTNPTESPARYFRAPGEIGSSWAAGADSICEITPEERVSCALTFAQSAPPLLPPPRAAAKIGWAEVGKGPFIAARCLSCPQPAYPEFESMNRIEGDVVLHAIIGRAGTIKSLQLVHAPDAALAESAIEAVRNWIYAPTLLGGKPVEVDTEITLRFTLGP